ncbi:DUF4286 family protein [Microdochium nivale]|nr:DUF4286 family protein [Microdochium nivale]
MAAPPADMSGKGLLFVNSRISSDLLDEATLLRWYDEDHIPEILATSGVESAVRFVDEAAKGRESEGGRPYLHVYPLQDIKFLVTPEFAAISVTSELLPGSGLVYDLVDFDVRYYSLVQVYDPTGKGPGHTRSVLYAHFALHEGYPSEDLDSWYRQEHLPQLAQTKGYVRSTRYKLVWGRNSETSRAFKGAAAEGSAGSGSGSGSGSGELPEWFALHEFETETLDAADVQRLMSTEWTQKVFANSKQVLGMARLDRAHGSKELHHGEKL